MPYRCLIIMLLTAGIRAQTPSGGCDFEGAVRLHQAGNLDGAAEAYRGCLRVDPGRVEVRSNLGAVLARLGRYQDAIGEYREALKSAPADIAPRLRFNLALAYYKSFDIPSAAKELTALQAAQPTDLNLALLLADCRLRMGEFQKAVELIEPLEPAHREDAALNYVLGMSLIRLGRVTEGQVRVDRLLKGGDSAEGHFLMGSALFTAGNYPAALKELMQAVALNPEVPSLQSYMGQALLFTGDPDGAIAAFRKELAANPNDFDANFQLASILASRGQAPESRSLVERAVQVRPESAEARRALTEGFHFQQMQASDPGVPVGSAAPAIGKLTFTDLTRPVVLVFGSYTCPKLRTSAADLKRLAELYHESVDFKLVYISEAHSNGGPESQWQSTINQKEGIDLPPARSLAEKQEHATMCQRKLSLPFAIEVDGMDTAAEQAYQSFPSRLYLVDRSGKVAFQTRLGEQDFHPQELERAIRQSLPGKGADAHL